MIPSIWRARYELCAHGFDPDTANTAQDAILENEEREQVFFHKSSFVEGWSLSSDNQESSPCYSVSDCQKVFRVFFSLIHGAEIPDETARQLRAMDPRRDLRPWRILGLSRSHRRAGIDLQLASSGSSLRLPGATIVAGMKVYKACRLNICPTKKVIQFSGKSNVSLVRRIHTATMAVAVEWAWDVIVYDLASRTHKRARC
jgi:hypothetical protein